MYTYQLDGIGGYYVLKDNEVILHQPSGVQYRLYSEDLETDALLLCEKLENMENEKDD